MNVCLCIGLSLCQTNKKYDLWSDHFNVYSANTIDQVCVAGLDTLYSQHKKHCVPVHLQRDVSNLFFVHKYSTTSHFFKKFKYNDSYWKQSWLCLVFFARRHYYVLSLASALSKQINGRIIQKIIHFLDHSGI